MCFLGLSAQEYTQTIKGKIVDSESNYPLFGVTVALFKDSTVVQNTTTDEDGYPVRDPDSTTYVGAIESSEQFGWRIHAEAVRRGLEGSDMSSTCTPVGCSL